MSLKDNGKKKKDNGIRRLDLTYMKLASRKERRKRECTDQKPVLKR